MAMDNTSPRTPAGVVVSLLTSLGLLGLFFMPWLKLSCDPLAASNAADLRGLQNAPVDLTRPTVLAHASGWDLARGQLTPAEPFKDQATQENSSRPPAKHWAYAGLALPALLTGLALLCLGGRLSSTGAGKWLLLLGIAGVALMSLAASMDYIDEAMDQAKGQMAAAGAPLGCPAFRQNVAAAADQAKKIIRTTATPYLWACLGMYVLIAGCGIGNPGYLQAAESAAWHDDEPAGLSLGRPLTAPAGAGLPPAAPPDFGPALPPRQATAAPAGDDPNRQGSGHQQAGGGLAGDGRALCSLSNTPPDERVE